MHGMMWYSLFISILWLLCSVWGWSFWRKHRHEPSTSQKGGKSKTNKGNPSHSWGRRKDGEWEAVELGYYNHNGLYEHPGGTYMR